MFRSAVLQKNNINIDFQYSVIILTVLYKPVANSN